MSAREFIETQGASQEALRVLAEIVWLMDAYAADCLAAERERNAELVEALFKLMKESAGFWALANVDDHGYTNLAVLKLRIDEAASALAKNGGQQ